MRVRGLVLLGVAAVLGLATIGLIRGHLAGPKPANANVPEVIVAAANLGFGDRISRENLRLVRWPEGSVPVGSFSSFDELVEQDRVVLKTMEPGEPVLKTKISGPGGRATLSTVIDKDMRAVTIRVNDVLGVAGFVLPGDRVDVLLTREDDRDNPRTELLLQNAKVLGIDQESSDRKDKPIVAKAVTLEVSTDDALKLTLGLKAGTLSLALRNLANPSAVPPRVLSLRDLHAGPVPTPVAQNQPAPAPPITVNPEIVITRGTARSVYEVKKDGTIGGGLRQR